MGLGIINILILIIILVIILVTLFSIIRALIITYNKLLPKLNNVKEKQRNFVYALERNDVSVERLHSLGAITLRREGAIQSRVASRRGGGSGPITFTVERPPNLSTLETITGTQGLLENWERDMFELWKDWSEAAKEYSTIRDTFPNIIFVSIFMRKKFPSVY